MAFTHLLAVHGGFGHVWASFGLPRQSRCCSGGGQRCGGSGFSSVVLSRWVETAINFLEKQKDKLNNEGSRKLQGFDP